MSGPEVDEVRFDCSCFSPGHQVRVSVIDGEMYLSGYWLGDRMPWRMRVKHCWRVLFRREDDWGEVLLSDIDRRRLALFLTTAGEDTPNYAGTDTAYHSGVSS
jgi:hypothetical protein